MLESPVEDLACTLGGAGVQTSSSRSEAQTEGRQVTPDLIVELQGQQASLFLLGVGQSCVEASEVLPRSAQGEALAVVLRDVLECSFQGHHPAVPVELRFPVRSDHPNLPVVRHDPVFEGDLVPPLDRFDDFGLDAIPVFRMDPGENILEDGAHVGLLDAENLVDLLGPGSVVDEEVPSPMSQAG